MNTSLVVHVAFLVSDGRIMLVQDHNLCFVYSKTVNMRPLV